jgi:hypothetical protein
MNDRLNREQTIFHAALQLAPDKRAAYLALACEGDDALRRRIQILLEAQVEADPFFRKDPLRVVLGEDPGEQATVATITENPGDRIGRYKILQQIGEGGCGAVNMAEQEEPVRRRVALKVIKLGMDIRVWKAATWELLVGPGEIKPNTRGSLQFVEADTHGARGPPGMGGADQTGLRSGSALLSQGRVGDEDRVHRAPPDRGDREDSAPLRAVGRALSSCPALGADPGYGLRLNSRGTRERWRRA